METNLIYSKELIGMGMTEIIIAVGAPSAIVGGFVSYLFRRIDRRLEREAAERRQREQAQQQYEVFQVRMTTAITKLCEANAIALQHGKCNGETHAALDYLQEVGREQRDFLVSKGIEQLF